VSAHTAISIRQRADYWLETIARVDPALLAFVHVARDGARAEAAALEARMAAGELLGPCAGLPLAVKDNIDVAGMPCTVGIASFRDRVPLTDARLVALWRAAGGIVLGKTNMDEGALGALTDNAAFGRCDNPAAPGFTAGGSSGGSAAAVASGMAPVALGSDTLGSVRIPASYCGVIGFKPTRGVLSRQGVAILSWSLDNPGIFARDIDRLITVFECLAVHDDEDPDSVALPDPAPRYERPLVIGVPVQLAQVTLEPEVAVAFAGAREALVRAGIEVREVDIPQWDPQKLRRSAFIVAEVEGAVSFSDLLADENSDITPAFRAMLEFGRDLPAPRYASARRYCTEVGFAARRVVQSVDALLLPTTPQRAFAHDADHPANQADLTALANAGGLPAISVPAPMEGRPVGLQLVGPALNDRRLLEIARQVQGTWLAT